MDEQQRRSLQSSPPIDGHRFGCKAQNELSVSPCCNRQKTGHSICAVSYVHADWLLVRSSSPRSAARSHPTPAPLRCCNIIGPTQSTRARPSTTTHHPFRTLYTRLLSIIPLGNRYTSLLRRARPRPENARCADATFHCFLGTSQATSDSPTPQHTPPTARRVAYRFSSTVALSTRSRFGRLTVT